MHANCLKYLGKLFTRTGADQLLTEFVIRSTCHIEYNVAFRIISSFFLSSWGR